MILRSRGADREYRDWGSSADIPAAGSGYGSYSGNIVTLDLAVGLPAVSAAIRLVSETIASLPFEVWRGQQADKRPASNSWQSRLFHQPNEDYSMVDFMCDIAASVEATGNAYVQKVKSGGKVEQMYVLDPLAVTVEREPKTLRKVFRVADQRVGSRTVDSSVILHVRGFTLSGGLAGISPIELHRHALGTGLAVQEVEGRYFANSASPPGAIQAPGNISRDEAKMMQREFEAKHSGLQNAHRPLILYNGATWAPIGLSLRDSQFVEAQGFTIEQVARIFRVPASLLDHTQEQETAQTPEAVAMHFLTFSLAPRLRRIEWAFWRDPDMFGAENPYPLFKTSELVRTDAKTKAEVRHLQIQDGSLLVDE